MTETSQAILFYGVRVGLSDSTVSDREKLIFVSSPGAFGFYQSPVGFVSRAVRDFEQQTMFFNELVLVSNSRLPSGTTFEINENSIIFKNDSVIDYYIYMASSYADTNTGEKNIATNASQAFKLYNDFVSDRSASIIKMTEDIRTGIISTGAINSEGNKISILVSNFVPDTTLTDFNGINKLPTDVKINRQYYAIKQFQRLDYWLGDDSYDNLSLGYKNATTEPTLSAFPNFSNTTADFGYDQKSLADTESGFTITLNDIDISYENYSVTARYVYQGGTLLTSDGYLIESAIEEIPSNIINGGKSLRFTPRNDIMSKRYTVCLIEIYLN
ncbi:hypothetical protein KFQ04_22110 [Pseudomonas synxantha]|nr:hypothetical protein KFQ04_22110 [Pseudomonas synxantha]